MNSEEAVQALRQNGVKVEGNKIAIPTGGIGIKLWKYADYLHNMHEYEIVYPNGNS